MNLRFSTALPLAAALLALLLAGCVSTTRSGATAAAPDTTSYDRLRPRFNLDGVRPDQSRISGLQYRILDPGKEPHPSASDKVVIHYGGWLDDGTVFDASFDRRKAAVMAVSSVIPGFAEGLQMIGPGGAIYLRIPPRLAYGESGAGRIPPNATLNFYIEMYEVPGK